jgi:hypothetical protein
MNTIVLQTPTTILAYNVLTVYFALLIITLTAVGSLRTRHSICSIHFPVHVYELSIDRHSLAADTYNTLISLTRIRTCSATLYLYLYHMVSFHSAERIFWFSFRVLVHGYKRFRVLRIHI